MLLIPIQFTDCEPIDMPIVAPFDKNSPTMPVRVPYRARAAKHTREQQTAHTDEAMTTRPTYQPFAAVNIADIVLLHDQVRASDRKGVLMQQRKIRRQMSPRIGGTR